MYHWVKYFCSGFPPFFDDNPFGIYEKILSGKIDWPKSIDNLGKVIDKSSQEIFDSAELSSE